MSFAKNFRPFLTYSIRLNRSTKARLGDSKSERCVDQEKTENQAQLIMQNFETEDQIGNDDHTSASELRSFPNSYFICGNNPLHPNVRTATHNHPLVHSSAVVLSKLKLSEVYVRRKQTEPLAEHLRLQTFSKCQNSVTVKCHK